VLVAEDDAVIALDLEATLRRLGCRVLGPAGSVEGALALLAAEALARAGVPFALVTGYGPGGLDGHPALRAAPVLAKPFGPRSLRMVLRRLLLPEREGGAP
jgi:two-component system, response regulator PdtaR